MDSIVSDFYQYVSGMMSEGSSRKKRRSKIGEYGNWKQREKDESLIDVLNKNTAYNIEWKMCKETLKGHVIISDLL